MNDSATMDDQHPSGEGTLLAIEVSDSSLRSDRIKKADLYAEAGIQEHWVVDVQVPCNHILREVAADGHYGWQRTANGGDNVSPIAKPDATFNVAGLFGVCSTSRHLARLG
ncbi:hypothetical protein Q31b_21900 [Novipirellula aureliae]|uniref:Putative restriction endonuclease domain-containing protein n=1 Tax=Novipirellula aureliae TaxID=2527966 RepID=A0A5C6E2J8_9BACT|nr:Uma2 family endonuclease [Novipirellula aureliae]TWU43152.1 hypothetical protein Q31b_21900 [Novipirellula aureliae]